MLKALLFDCGGVLVAPTTGDWALGPEYEDVLGYTMSGAAHDAFRAAVHQHISLLPDTRKIATDAEEHALFVAFYAAVFASLGQHLTQPQLERLAFLQTYRDDRYVFFGDVLPYLSKWQSRYTMGIVSDAPPSARRIMQSNQVLAVMQGATFSCDLGILKPDPRIFEATLRQLDVAPQEAVFLDDSPEKLQGALDLGMKAVQMVREMPALYKMPPQWSKGPVVRSFEAFDALLRTL